MRCVVPHCRSALLSHSRSSPFGASYAPSPSHRPTSCILLDHPVPRSHRRYQHVLVSTLGGVVSPSPASSERSFLRAHAYILSRTPKLSTARTGAQRTVGVLGMRGTTSRSGSEQINGTISRRSSPARWQGRAVIGWITKEPALNTERGRGSRDGGGHHRTESTLILPLGSSHCPPYPTSFSFY